MPTPIRASASAVTLCAMPQSAVMALQKANAIATMLRLLVRSAKHAESQIERHETEAGEQAHRHVGELELAFDRLDKHVENRAVEEVQTVNQRQQDKEVVAAVRRCGRSRPEHRLLLHSGQRVPSAPPSRSREAASGIQSKGVRPWT